MADDVGTVGKSYRLTVDEVALSSRLANGGPEIDGVRKVFAWASRVELQRVDEIERLKVRMQEFDISFRDLGADFQGERLDEGRLLLKRLRVGLKKFGKKEVVNTIDKECKAYGVELRGGNTVVQNASDSSEAVNSDAESVSEFSGVVGEDVV